MVIMPDTLAIAFVSSLHTTMAATTFDRLWRRSLATCQNGVMKYEEKKLPNLDAIISAPRCTRAILRPVFECPDNTASYKG
jgi:hypothetical protein